jgi:hypothetical protein
VIKDTKMYSINFKHDKTQPDQLEDAKGVIRSRKLKDRQQWPKENEQTMIHETIFRRLKIDQHEPHKTLDELRFSGRVNLLLLH